MRKPCNENDVLLCLNWMKSGCASRDWTVPNCPKDINSNLFISCHTMSLRIHYSFSFWMTWSWWTQQLPSRLNHYLFKARSHPWEPVITRHACSLTSSRHLQKHFKSLLQYFLLRGLFKLWSESRYLSKKLFFNLPFISFKPFQLGLVYSSIITLLPNRYQ